MDQGYVYLVMVGESNVDSSDNHNKYYEMQNNGDGTFTAKYGRIGASSQTKVYPISKWNSTYNSKIKKGYEDQTELRSDIIQDSKVEAPTTTETQDKFSIVKNVSVRNILKRLWDFSNNVVQSAYKVTTNQVTQAMVDKAQKQIDILATGYKDKTVEEFNKELKAIFKILPRKMKRVKDYLAESTDQFEKIIDREQSTLDTMAASVYVPKYLRKDESDKANEEVNVAQISILDEMGIEMEDCTQAEIDMLKEKMGDKADKFYKAWKVSNKETEEAFKEFTQENNIDNVQLLCHGSRNQNWYNILKRGLLIRPAGAIVTGSMFGGKALYFGNPKKFHGGVGKSVNYTSLRGSYWANGTEDCGFLAFFEVALGKSYDVYNFDPEYYSFDINKLKEKDKDAWHLFAHSDKGMLRNDEIVVYDTRQMTIKYLVEIR